MIHLNGFGMDRAKTEECLDASVRADKTKGVLRLREPVRFAHRLASLRMTVLFFSFVTFLFGSFSSGAQTSTASKALSPLEQTLIASERNLIEAKKKDDAALLKRMVTEDFSMVGVDGKLLEKQEAVGDLGDNGLIEIMPYDIRVVSVADGAAIVTYDAVVRKKPEEDQGPPPRYQHFSSVWVKQGDAWKLKFHQATAAHWGDW